MTDCMWSFVYALCMPARSLTLWVCYMWTCVFGCLCALFCPSGILGPQLQGTEFGSYPLLSWQWRGGVLKGPNCEESSQLSSCCTLPLVQLCVFLLVVFSLALGRGLCVCVILNVKICMPGMHFSLQKNKPSFFSPYTRWGPWQVASPWAVTGNYSQVLCVCIYVYKNQHWQWGQVWRANPDMLVLLSPSGPPQLWLRLRHSLVNSCYTSAIVQSCRRETHSAVEQCFHQKTIDRTTDMPGCFQGLGEKEGNEPPGVFLWGNRQSNERKHACWERQKHANTFLFSYMYRDQ